MTPFRLLAANAAAALLLSAETPALAGSDTPLIRIQCSDARFAAVCDGLQSGLAEKHTSFRVVLHVTPNDASHHPRMVTVQFVPVAQNEQRLLGHLNWLLPNGQASDGPELELTVMDAAINGDLLRDYGRQLAQVTPIPL